MISGSDKDDSIKKEEGKRVRMAQEKTVIGKCVAHVDHILYNTLGSYKQRITERFTQTWRNRDDSIDTGRRISAERDGDRA